MEMLEAGCLDCVSRTECIACDDGLILSPHNEGCIEPIQNCEVDPEFYKVVVIHGVPHYECPVCSEGLTWHPEKFICATCDAWNPDCELCNFDDGFFECDQCSSDENGVQRILDPYRQQCIYPIANCLDNVNDYLDINGQWACVHCENQMYWDSTAFECANCSNIDVWCDSCHQENGLPQCDTCSGGRMPQATKDECVFKFRNCAQASLAEQPDGLNITYTTKKVNGVNVQVPVYYCPVCEETFAWDDSEWNCMHIEVDYCLEGPNEFTCSRC